MKGGSPPDFLASIYPGTDAGIQAAITYALSVGGEVMIGPGTVTVDTALTYGTGGRVIIRGCGRGATKLIRGAGSNSLISSTSTHLTSEWYCGLRDLTLDGNNGNGTVCSLSGYTFFDMHNVTISNCAHTGLALKSMYDSHFSNVYVENCGDSTHPFVTLDANSASDTLNNCQFYNFHVEANNQDAILLDLLGTGASSVVSNYFFGLKLHGNSSTGNPNRPLLRLGANADQNGFWGGEISYGRGSSQVECSGDRNRFEAQRFGIASAFPAARAFQFIGGSNSVFDAYFINSNLYTTACLRFDAGANNCYVLNPFLASGGTTLSDAATGTVLLYRDITSGTFKIYAGDSVHFPQGPVLDTNRIFATGSGSNGHLIPNAGAVDMSFLLDSLADIVGNLRLSNTSQIYIKDTGGTYQKIATTSASNLLKWYPIASGQSLRWQNFADTRTNLEIADAGIVYPFKLVQTVFALTDAATISVDASLGNVATVTLAGNRTMGAPSSGSTGQKLLFKITQDGTGGRTLTWNAVFKQAWVDTGNTLNKFSTIAFWYDGTNWIQDGAQSPYI